MPGDGGLLPLQKVQGDGGEGQGQLWESFGRDYVGSSGLTLVIPPSGEEGVRSHQEARHPFPAPSSPPPHPQAGGIALPQGWPRASGNVQRYDQQRRQWRPRSAPGRPTGSGFPAEETEATVFSSSGRVWSSRACSSHSAGPPCRSVNSGQRACRASHRNLSHSLWGPDCLGPAASWRTWHRPQRDHTPTLLGLPGLVTNPAG